MAKSKSKYFKNSSEVSQFPLPFDFLRILVFVLSFAAKIFLCFMCFETFHTESGLKGPAANQNLSGNLCESL